MTWADDDGLTHDSRDCKYDGCDGVESEPECEEGLDHRWTSAGEGGCSENPGVWGKGGTTIVTAEHCVYCGVRRVTQYCGSQRNPGECDSREYTRGNPDEQAITIERRRLRRNTKARARRRAKIGAAFPKYAWERVP